MSMSTIAKCPDCNNEFLYKGHAKRPRVVCKKCKKKFYISALDTQNNNSGPEETKPPLGLLPSIPPQDTTQVLQFIDDPNELLLSVAKRELNKPNPDPRWANILISCKKENISTKAEVLEQFKQQPTQLLVNLLNKSLQKEPS